ncbi:MAG TPA: hypothetical protein V6D22_04180 [Candidatus Obscuribacterales bacterium]
MKHEATGFIRSADAVTVCLLATVPIAFFAPLMRSEHDRSMLSFLIGFVISLALLCTGAGFERLWKAGGVDRRAARLWLLHFGYVCLSFACCFLMAVFTRISQALAQHPAQFDWLLSLIEMAVLLGITFAAMVLGITARAVASAKDSTQANNDTGAGPKRHHSCARDTHCSCCIGHRTPKLFAKLSRVILGCAILPMVALVGATAYMHTGWAQNLHLAAQANQRQLRFEEIKKQLEELNKQERIAPAGAS